MDDSYARVALVQSINAGGRNAKMAFPSEELCPISDDELGRLYRSSPEGLDALVQSVSPGIRALLAYYCSRRAHLFSLGLTIAKTCTAEDLYDVAGRAGWDLFARAQASQVAEPVKPKSRYGITLAAGTLWKIPGFEEHGREDE
jgi:hypothetical protein